MVEMVENVLQIHDLRTLVQQGVKENDHIRFHTK